MKEHIDSHQNAPVAQLQEIAPAQDTTVQVSADTLDDEIITWEASEFAQYDKSVGWFIVVFSVGLIISIGMFFVVDLMSASVVLFMTIALIIYAKFKPRSLRYTISRHGISVGDSDYRFSAFRSFSIMSNEGLNSIFLVPMERFKVPITMYMAPENQEQIINTLSIYLPNQQRQPDLLDRVTSKLRF